MIDGTMSTGTAAEQKLDAISSQALQPGENPYSAFIKACDDNHVNSLIPRLDSFSHDQTRLTLNVILLE